VVRRFFLQDSTVMTSGNDTPAALTRLLADSGLTPDTSLFREVVFSALVPTGTQGVFRIAANAHPSESVVDVYAQGHVVQAEQVGPGLAFAETARPNWQETMEMRAMRLDRATGALPDPHVEVEVTLDDILQQGGLIYPVESVTVERAWYCTMPSGHVDVRVMPQI
jgi:hypothetical protein